MVIRQGEVILPNGSGHFHCCNLHYAVHYSDICEVNDMAETPVIWSVDQQDNRRKNLQQLLLVCQPVGKLSPQVYIFNRCAKGCVTWCIVECGSEQLSAIEKTVTCWRCLFMYLWLILAHYPNPVKDSHNVSPQVLPTVVAWYWLEANNLCLHFFFFFLGIDFMCALGYRTPHSNLWNILAFSRDFYKVPWPSLCFYRLP